MLAEFVFTPAESKLLLARGIAKLPQIQQAFREGILAIHPSSSTYFLPEALTGKPFAGTGVWVTGCIVPKGLCISKSYGASGGSGAKSLSDPGEYPHTMVFCKGEPLRGITIRELMERMGPKDVYIKGANALDASGNVGIILGSQGEGSIGLMMRAAAKHGFSIYSPIGYEKLVPGDLRDTAEYMRGNKDYAMGVRGALLPITSTPYTEIDVFRDLAGAEARVFACGGLQGAEGAVVIAVKGTPQQVEKAIELAEAVKGAKLPGIDLNDCKYCTTATCHMAEKPRHWC